MAAVRFHRRFILALIIAFFLNGMSIPSAVSDEIVYFTQNKILKKGLRKKKIFRYFTQPQIRTLRVEDEREWVTVDIPDDRGHLKLVTFHFTNGILQGWAVNDRDEIIREYLEEFAGPDFNGYPNIYRAIVSVLNKIPMDVFLKVTDRAHPVIFTEYHTSGMSRIANSSEYVNQDGAPPAFTKGVYILKLSSELDSEKDQLAVEGIIMHELAHRALDHLGQNDYSKDMEKEANHLIMDWGFSEEFNRAKEKFGSR